MTTKLEPVTFFYFLGYSHDILSMQANECLKQLYWQQSDRDDSVHSINSFFFSHL